MVSLQQRYELGYPLHSLAIDPQYARKQTRSLCIGGEKGELVFASKGWLGARYDVKHGSEGPITRIVWSGPLVAWANSRGVHVFDTTTQRVIRFFERGSGVAPGARCHLLWEADRLLHIAWGNTLRVARVFTMGQQPGSAAPSPAAPGQQAQQGAAAPGQAPDAAAVGVSTPPGPVGASAAAATRYMDVLLEVDLADSIACGAAPFGPDLLCLTYQPAEDPGRGSARVELQAISWDRHVISVDRVAPVDLDFLDPADMLLAAYYPPFIPRRSACFDERYARSAAAGAGGSSPLPRTPSTESESSCRTRTPPATADMSRAPSCTKAGCPGPAATAGEGWKRAWSGPSGGRTGTSPPTLS